MTSPAVLLLHLALICSSVGVISERTADISTKHKNMRNLKKTIQELVKEDVYDSNLGKNTRTNVLNAVYNRLLYDVDYSKYEKNSFREREIAVDNVEKDEEILGEKHGDILDRHIINVHSDNIDKVRKKTNSIKGLKRKKRVRRDEKVNKCDSFNYEKGKTFLSHPHIGDNDNVNYSSSTHCTTVIRAPVGNVIQLTFIDMFHIEEHPECDNDYLEIRDGDKGYYNLLGKLCGDKFPPQITTTGPYAWLKFHSDDTIEYKGFRIQIDFIPKDTSYSVPETCVTHLSGKFGKINSKDLNKDCEARTKHAPRDYLWSIEVPADHKIYLNFTTYLVGKPNECDLNFVEVFGSVLEDSEKLEHYCGSVANPVYTGLEAGNADEYDDERNKMYVRLYAAQELKETTLLNATFTAYRTLDLTKNNSCDPIKEFDCQDNTCIDSSLKCDNYANCRLKADEERDLCKHTTESLMSQSGIKIIVSIFSVILSGIVSVFIFKCIMKLYNDHKIIKEQISKSCEDKLDSMFGSQLLLDSKRMQSDVGPRASLERDNQTNEMFKQQRKLQLEVRPTSIDSDFKPEIHRDLEEELWGGKLNEISDRKDERIERNGKPRGKERYDTEDINIEKSDERKWQKEEKVIDDIKTDRKERKRKKEEKQENLRKKEELNRKKKSEDRDQISEAREVSVGVPDTKQSGCQTRESLFDTEPIMSSNGSGSANRGSGKFGYRSASIARPSPSQIKPSDIVIEVIRPNIELERITQKKILADRRPMSAETTRSAPDVIILAKPGP